MTAPLRFGLNLLVDGDAEGLLLRLEQPLSFWGGVDPDTGRIIDRQHPQCGRRITGTVLALPATRGSTAAPGALLACLAGGHGPAAIIILDGVVTPLAALLAGQLIEVPPVPLARLANRGSWRALPTGGQALVSRRGWLEVSPLRPGDGPRAGE